MDIIMMAITIYIVSVILIIITLYTIQNSKKKSLKKEIVDLEILKNKIDSAPIMPELAKIEAYLNNEKLEILYNNWKNRLESIRKEQITKINDMLIDTEYSLSRLDYLGTIYKVANLEMEIYKVRENSAKLLGEIKEITTSEEKNRDIITKLKKRYRDLYESFNQKQEEYGEIAKPISLQFENISKRFEDFELVMEQNEYTEVTKIIRAIDEMLEHIQIVVEEVPSIIMMANIVLPKQIKEAKDTYKSMQKEGYPLDYLNIDDNIKKSNSKINDIVTRAKVLNLEDSLFELKVLHEYFDNLFNDFEKEKISKNNYLEKKEALNNRLSKMNELLYNIFSQLEELKNVYNMSNKDIELLTNVREETKKLTDSYETLIAHTGNNTFAYSQLIKEVEALAKELIVIEESLNTSLDALGSMKEDEMRAREQLEEIKNIVREAIRKINISNIPTIPDSYHIYLDEANSSINDIILELNKKPITISVLNTRVDTARDLALKLLAHAKDIIRYANMSEIGIIYGNRYRSTYKEVDNYLSAGEMLFYEGDYYKSLEVIINCLNRLEPGIKEKLKSLYNGR